MATLPTKSVENRIETRIDSITIEEYPRGHLGASQIGHPCRRHLVYQFFWAHKNKVNAKLGRIFSLGNSIEDLIVQSLEGIDIRVTNQQDQVSGYMGHAGGSIDGIVTNVPGFEDTELLFEAKSMNHSNYLELKRKGVLEAKPVHYDQIQMYMGKLELKFTLYVAYDKNTSDLYTEILMFDESQYDSLVAKERDVLEASHIGEYPRISSNPSWYICKTCDSRGVCHSGEQVEQNCRTCDMSQMDDEGIWYCVNHDKVLSIEDQKAGCNEYEIGSMWC